MSDIVGLFKGLFDAVAPQRSAAAVAEDADFADFAGAPDPSPIAFEPSVGSASLANAASATAGPGPGLAELRPFTKWYRVWERVTPADFYSEAFILPFLILIIACHIWGTRTNRRKARSWITAHANVLEQEYAVVGFASRKPNLTAGEDPATRNIATLPQDMIKERGSNDFISYATGRQNVAFTDFKLTLLRRYNPMSRIGEEAIGFFMESQPAPRERMEATTYVFDGKEHDLAPYLASKQAQNTDEKKEKFKSAYDGFVFAVVHKDAMKILRDARYDLSLTTTKDHVKLPVWTTLMSESAEVADQLLTPELIQAIKDAGDDFECLVVTDQPIDQPKKLDDTVPRKRVSLSLRLPSGTDTAAYTNTMPVFKYFLHLPDILASIGKFRPEALRRVKATREEEIRKIRRTGEDERAEERRLKSEKEKKEEREKKLRGMNAEEQKKFLEKEKSMDMRRSQKKKTMKA